MKTKIALLSVTVMGFAVLGGVASAATLDDYEASSLSAGSINSWAPVTGSDTATTSNYTGLGSPLANSTVANTDSVFNGHNYVYFGTDAGLATTTSSITGAAPRSLAVVYATTSAPTATAAIAGISLTGTPGTWFMLQSRNNVVTGDPYLAGYADDLSNGQAPAAERLTFALATYDGTTASIYWAYGTTGAINSVSTALTLNTSGQFDMGFNPGELSPGQLELGSAILYNSAMTSTQADAEIHALQLQYSEAPEPSTWALLLGGVGALVFIQSVRSRKVVNS